MKKLSALLVFSILVLSLPAQNYKPFDRAMTKVFGETSGLGNLYCLAADSAVASGTDSVYYFYTHLNDTLIESDTCSFWGGNQCFVQDRPIWSGLKAVGRQDGSCLFFNVSADTLNFRFDMQPGDTSLIAQTLNERFWLTCTGYSQSTILGFADSVKKFRVLHTDLFGQVIASAIHQQPVTIAKTLGLTDFIRVDSFPQLLKPLRLEGQPRQLLGVYEITEGMIYDHLPGDVIQTRYQRFANPGPPWYNYVRYTKHTFLSRQEQPGLLSYEVATETFYADSAGVQNDTITLTYFPERVAIAAPFDRHNQESLVYNSVYYSDYDGFTGLTYDTEPGYLMYCVADNCWGFTDTFGPPPSEGITFVCGLGVWKQHYWEWQPGVSSMGFDEQVVYFKRGGVAYGNQFFVGTDNKEGGETTLTIAPNPCADEVVVTMAHQVNHGQLVVLDLNGRVLIKQICNGSKANVDVSGLAAGTYLVKTSSTDRIQKAVMIKR